MRHQLLGVGSSADASAGPSPGVEGLGLLGAPCTSLYGSIGGKLSQVLYASIAFVLWEVWARFRDIQATTYRSVGPCRARWTRSGYLKQPGEWDLALTQTVGLRGAVFVTLNSC